MKVNKDNGLTTISFYWDDLTDKAKKKLQETLGLEEGDDNNWTYVPFAMLDIQDDTEYGVYYERSRKHETGTSTN